MGSDSLLYSRGGQYQLLDWLEMVTFPTEAKFAETDCARRSYRSVIRRTLDAGVRLVFPPLARITEISS